MNKRWILLSVLVGMFSVPVYAGNIPCPGSGSAATFSTWQSSNKDGAKLIKNACGGTTEKEVPTNVDGVVVQARTTVVDLLKLMMCGISPDGKPVPQGLSTPGTTGTMGFDVSGNWKSKITILFDPKTTAAMNHMTLQESPVELDDRQTFVEVTKIGNYCKDIWEAVDAHQKVTLVTCHYEDLSTCTTPILWDFNFEDIYTGQGFAVKVSVALVNAAYKVRSGIPLGNTPNDIIALKVLNGTNLPIYQVLNIAAIQPTVGIEMLTNMGIIYAKLMVHQYFEDLLRRMRQNMPIQGIPAQMTTRLDQAMTTMNREMAQMISTAKDDMLKQTEMMKKIQEITKSIRQETMTAELQNNLQYTNSLLRSNR